MHYFVEYAVLCSNKSEKPKKWILHSMLNPYLCLIGLILSVIVMPIKELMSEKNDEEEEDWEEDSDEEEEDWSWEEGDEDE
jgi:hypothetical protein